MTFDYAKRRAEADLINAIHPGTVRDPDWDLKPSDGPPDFQGGVRGEHGHLHPQRLHAFSEPGGWVTIEYEDGADWMWPGLGR